MSQHKLTDADTPLFDGWFTTNSTILTLSETVPLDKVDAKIIQADYMGRIENLQTIITHLREENVTFTNWINELETKLNEVYYRRGVSY
jgi:Holliday junction resolvasome RuvABC ATP-dependent DNA helicase subunit